MRHSVMSAVIWSGPGATCSSNIAALITSEPDKSKFKAVGEIQGHRWEI